MSVFQSVVCSIVAFFLATWTGEARSQLRPCGGTCVSGQPPCVVASGNGAVDFPVFDCDGAGGDISIRVLYEPGVELQGTSVTINVYKPNAVIGNIRVIIANRVSPQLNNNVTLSVRGINGGSISSIGSIERSGTNGELWIGEVLANNIGSVIGVRATTIRSLAGNITGPIIATGGQNQPGSIDVIEALGSGGLGKILGNISAANSIGTIAASSDIGTLASPVSITWGTNSALSDTSLGTLQAANVYANITAASPISGTRGKVTKVRTTSGVFNGSLSALEFVPSAADSVPGVFTNGALNANVSLASALSSSSFIKAGTTLAGAITLPASGLVGQIVPNALNATSNAWAGSITVGSIVLDPSTFANGAYPDTSSSLGGGSVGQVTYQLHRSDCVPALDGVPGSTPSNPLYIVPAQLAENTGFDFAFYGPIERSNALEHCLRLYRMYPGTNGAYYLADVTCKTAQSLAPTDLSLPRRNRVFRVRGIEDQEFPLGAFELTTRVYPATHYCTIGGTSFPSGQLKNSQTLLTTTPPNVGVFSVYFKVVPDCDGDDVADPDETGLCFGQACCADLDDGSGYGSPDEAVDINDLLFFLSAFELGSLAADLSGVNGGCVSDSAVNVDDLLFFLASFEAGC